MPIEKKKKFKLNNIAIFQFYLFQYRLKSRIVRAWKTRTCNQNYTRDTVNAGEPEYFISLLLIAYFHC